jgi:hypothetical protein
MPSQIEQLPETARQQVIDALLAGKSLRDVAEIAGTSHVAVQRYKRNTFRPALRTAQQLRTSQQLSCNGAELTATTAALTKAVVGANPILRRIQEHSDTIDEAINAAGGEGDHKSIASLIRTDLVGLELTARLSGLLDASSAPQTVVAIAMTIMPPPSAVGENPQVIDLSPVK